jgi:hypothetical protein
LITAAIWNQDVVANVIALLPGGWIFLIDGGGAVPGTGIQPGVVEVPYDCGLVSVRLFSDVVGTIEIDIWDDVYANYPPTSADSIVGGSGTMPILSAANKYQDSTFTNWVSTSFSVGDVLYFNVETSPAPATLTWAAVSMRVSRS